MQLKNEQMKKINKKAEVGLNNIGKYLLWIAIFALVVFGLYKIITLLKI